MPITFEEQIQVVLNIIMERDDARRQLIAATGRNKELEARVVELEKQLKITQALVGVRKPDNAEPTELPIEAWPPHAPGEEGENNNGH